MTSLIVNHELKLTTNMQELAERILSDIKEKYDVIVTDDTVTESKRLMAAVNKEKDDFKRTYKAFKEAIIEPLKPIDAKAKEIEGYYDEARSKIANQVQTFELEKLNQVKTVCTEYKNAICSEKGIDPKSIIIEDITQLLTSIGSNGKISSTAKEKIDNRIAVIENQILKAKLEAEEKERKNREIADRARIEAETAAKLREAELLAKAEIEKIKAVELAKFETEQRLAKETVIVSAPPAPVQPVIQSNGLIDIEPQFDFSDAPTKNKFKVFVEMEISYDDFNSGAKDIRSFLAQKQTVTVISIVNADSGEVR